RRRFSRRVVVSSDRRPWEIRLGAAGGRVPHLASGSTGHRFAAGAAGHTALRTLRRGRWQSTPFRWARHAPQPVPWGTPRPRTHAGAALLSVRRARPAPPPPH